MKRKLEGKRSWVAITLSLFVLVSGMTNIAFAGSGNSTADDQLENRSFRMCARVGFNASSAQLEAIRATLQAGSDALQQATEKRQYFDEIRIINNDVPVLSPEIDIRSGAGRAYNSREGLGKPGASMVLKYDSNIAGNATINALTIAREFLQSICPLYPQDRGPSIAASGAISNRATLGVPITSEGANLSVSLLDNFLTRGGAGSGNYTLQELSFDTDPNEMESWQWALNGASEWNTLSTNCVHNVISPLASPLNDPVTSIPVTFQDAGTRLDVHFVFDTSGSMSGTRIANAIAAGSAMVGFMPDGSALSVSEFNTEAQTVFNRTVITDDTVRNNAIAQIEALIASGGTNITDGLAKALAQVDSSVASCNQQTLLMTDGDHNSGAKPNTIEADLADAFLPTFSVALGSGISATGASEITSVSANTGGTVTQVVESVALTGQFLSFVMELTGGGLAAQSDVETVGDNETKEYSFLVDPDATRGVFALAIEDEDDTFTFSLVDPSNTTITSAVVDPNIDYKQDSSGTTLFYDITNPASGTWKMIVNSGSVDTGKFQASAGIAGNGIQLVAYPGKPLGYNYPEEPIINAELRYKGERVVGAAITADVFDPKGNFLETITLQDSGSPADDDAIPADGVSSKPLRKFSENGFYTLVVRASTVGANAMTFGGEEIYASAGTPSNASSVPEFTRAKTISLLLSGLPSPVPSSDLAASLSSSISRTAVNVSMTVSNNGTDDAANVKVQLVKPDELGFISCAGPDDSADGFEGTGGSEVPCAENGSFPLATLTSLTDGESKIINYAFRRPCFAASSDTVNLLGTADANEPDPNFSDNQTVLSLSPTDCSLCAEQNYAEEIGDMESALKSLRNVTRSAMRKAGASNSQIKSLAKLYKKDRPAKRLLEDVVTCPEDSCKDTSTGKSKVLKLSRKLRKSGLKAAKGLSGAQKNTERAAILGAYNSVTDILDSYPAVHCPE